MSTRNEDRLVALTGISGFIGRNLARCLVASGWRVRGLVRGAMDPPASGPALDVELVRGSLEDFAALRQLLDGAGVVIHCAGAVRGAAADAFERVNVTGFGNLLEVMHSRKRPPRLLHLSSLAARQPQLSWYAASKKAGEDLLAGYPGLTWTVLRPPAVYGPGDREMLPVFRLLARGLAVVPGSGRGRFSLLHVEDLAQAVVALLENGAESAGRTFELSDGCTAGYDWFEIVALAEELRGKRVRMVHLPLAGLRGVAALNLAAARVFGYRPMLTPGKVREIAFSDWVADPEPLIQATGWRPRIGLREGLEPLCRWS